MRIKLTVRVIFFLFGFSFLYQRSEGQTKITDYPILSGPNGTGTTIVGSSITINGVSSTGFKGTVGAYKLVQTTGNATIKANILSGDKISITNSNVIQGNIAAGNSSNSTGTVISIGNSISLTGNIDSKGNIVVGGGTVNGKVNVFPGSYSGPAPSTPLIGNSPQVPDLPAMPAAKRFSAPPTTNITGNTTLTSNSRDTIFSGNINFSGNKTLRLVNPGVYVFNSFQWSGNSNNLIFDFNSNTTGIFYIYVKNNADFGKLNATIANATGINASRIYVEIQGDGTTGTSIAGFSCVIQNGSSGGGSKWQGTVYAVNGGINLGSGTGSSGFTGALYSGKAVTLQSGVTVNFEPFNPCGGLSADAGPDRPLDFVGHATLNGTSTISGSSFNWTASNGGIITTSPTTQSQISVESQGTYTLTVQDPVTGCIASDAVNVSGRLKSIIGSELQSIYDNKTTDTTYFDILNGYVKIDIIANAGKRDSVLLKLLESLNPTKKGLKDTVPNGLSPLTITGRFFIDSLPKLNLMGSTINFCRPYYKPILFTTGDIVVADTSRVGIRSEGDTTMKTHLVRLGYSLYGDGVKIGVLSDSYNSKTLADVTTANFEPILVPPYILNSNLDTIGTRNLNPDGTIKQTVNTNIASTDILNRDIPASVTIVPVSPPITGSDEGRAMMQIVHDIAPGSPLYFRSGFHTAGDLANGIRQLRDLGCKVIVDDITYTTEPFLKDGIVAKTVDQVKADGVVYVSSAGNFGNKSYEANFNPYNFNGKTVHNFATSGPADPFEKIRLAPGDYVFVFQWLDNIYSLSETVGTVNDFDIFLTKREDGSGLIGFNRDNLVGDPIEFIPITVPPGDSVDYNIFIVNNTPNLTTPRIKYVVFRGNPRFLESYHTGASTLIGQANANGAIAVGATRFNHQPGHPLLPNKLSGITKPEIETFSSLGGTLMMGEASPRLKPDVVGPDGVRTTVKMGQDYPDWKLDGWSNFFGTSAAAPHVAAAAALIIQGRDSFLHQATSPDQVKTLLQDNAIDMATPGFDFISGRGLIDAFATMRSFAEPRPHNIRLVLPEPLPPPGTPTFQIIIVGENFSSNTEIWYNDTKLTPDRISPTLDTIWVTVPVPDPNEGHTEIRAYNPPKDGGLQLDGGFSNSLFFGEADVVVTALNVSKKYGQAIPSTFNTLITINGKRLQDTTLTLADLGLQNMLVTANAPLNPDIGSYTVTPSFDPANPPGQQFFFRFNYTFIPGNLVITRMPLTVTPNPITITDGQPLGNVTFTYNFDQTGVTNPQAILNDLKAAHAAFLPNNALAIIKDFSTSGLDTSALRNMNTMASFNAVNNSRKFQLDPTGVMVPLTDPNTFPVQYLVDVAAQSLIDYRQNPALAKFYAAYPGINKKALLGGNAINDRTARVNVNNTLEPIVNGTLTQTLTTNSGSKTPIINNELVQIINGQLVQYNTTNHTLEPIVNQELVQIVNNELVQIVNTASGPQIQPLANNELVQLVNNALLMMVNNELVQIVNGVKVQEVNGVLEPIVNSPLVLLVNNELVQLVNNTLEPLVNNELVQLVNNELVQMVNNELVQMVNGELVQIINNSLEPIVNQALIQIVNNELVQIVNGVITPIPNNQLVLFPNNELVQMVNNELVQIVNYVVANGAVDGNVETFVNYANLNLVNSELVQLVNNELVQIVNGVQQPIPNSSLMIFPNNELVQIVNNSLEPIVNNGLEPIVNSGLEPIVNQGLVQMVNSNTTGVGNTNNNTGVIIDEADINDAQNNWLGPMFAINTVTGLSVGKNYLVPGKLVNPNFDITYKLGTVTVNPNQCLLTHSAFKNFGNTTVEPLSMWFNLTTKISGQLNTKGDYLLFKGGTVTFNFVNSNPLIKDSVLPNGIIIADNVPAPITGYDAATNTWVTRVPVGFASTSDIFVTGKIINSSTGFVKQNGNTNVVAKGMFYCSKPFSDQWAYALAAYKKPAGGYISYSDIGGCGQVASINGTYKSGAPTTITQWLVSGGSGGGGNNYSGSKSSYDNFTACSISASLNYNLCAPAGASSRLLTNAPPEREQAETIAKELVLMPNPATNQVTLSYVPKISGASRITVLTIDGKKLIDMNTGMATEGRQYIKTIDVSRLPNGIYLVQLQNADKITVRKFIISR